MRLDSQVALITGAASGIGRAVMGDFLREGAAVIAADIDEERLLATVAGRNSVTPVRLDVSSEADWEAAFRGIERLDVLVASAGISHARPVMELGLDEWRRVMAVNLDGAFLGIRHAAPAMMRRKSGSIVLIASASGIKASAGAAAYCTSKAGVRMA